MAESDDREIGQLLKAVLGNQEKQGYRTDCPEEEILADYLRGDLTEVQTAGVQEHLGSCAACVDALIASAADAPESEVDVPRALTERIAHVIDENLRGAPFLDLAVRLGEDAIELVRTTGRWQYQREAEPVPLRGGGGVRVSDLQIATEMAGYNVAVYVEHAEQRCCDVVIGISAPAGAPVDGMRVSLFSDDRERVSYLTREGRVVFDGVTQGKYTLPIRERSTLIGTVRLEIG